MDGEYYPASLGKLSGRKLYGLIREKKPEIILETGVANGFSTSVILKALEDNDKGLLYSIDMPVFTDDEDEERKGAVIPAGRSSGWVVPDDLRGKWTFIKGNTFYKLPEIHEKLKSIDIFLHDSEHSYHAMMFEFSIGWKHLTKGGYLLADNIERNQAFHDFAEAKETKKYRMGDLGMMIK